MHYLQIVDAESKTKIIERKFEDAEAVSVFVKKFKDPNEFYRGLVNEEHRYISCEYVNHVILICGENTFYRVYFKTELGNVYA